MWRRKAFPENLDSDQSISDDDDDLCSDWPQDCVSLSKQAENKRKLGIQSQFQTLRGVDELVHGKKICGSSEENRAGFSFEDVVEVSHFQNESDLSCSPEKAYASDSDVDNIPDDEENNVLSKMSILPGAEKLQEVSCDSSTNGKHCETDVWSAVNREAESLVRLNENASCSSSHPIQSGPNKYFQGSRLKARPKFSFRFPAPKEGICWPPICMVKDNELIRSGSMGHRIEDNSSYVLCDQSHGQEKQLEPLQAEVEDPGHGCIQHSMVELLGCLQDKNSMLQENYKMVHLGKIPHTATKRSISSLGERIIDNEDPPEPIGSGSSTDDEAVHQDLKLVVREEKRQTMVDRFQEVISAASLNEGSVFALPRPLSGGLFGKLQQVMLTEKERDMSFLKILQAGASLGDEPGCVYVKIVSRYLDAKLTVCRCSLVKNTENLLLEGTNTTAVENEASRQTIIFNPRVCSDVELEVGNLICIHPPWKEVQVVSNNERLILSTYFSRIHYEHFGTLSVERGEQLLALNW